MMVDSATTLERIARLEAKFEVMEDKFTSFDGKLDNLLSLRDKGAGAFWLASSLAGVGAISIFVQIVTWFGSLIGKH